MPSSRGACPDSVNKLATLPAFGLRTGLFQYPPAGELARFELPALALTQEGPKAGEVTMHQRPRQTLGSLSKQRPAGHFLQHIGGAVLRGVVFWTEDN